MRTYEKILSCSIRSSSSLPNHWDVLFFLNTIHQVSRRIMEEKHDALTWRGLKTCLPLWVTASPGHPRGREEEHQRRGGGGRRPGGGEGWRQDPRWPESHLCSRLQGERPDKRWLTPPVSRRCLTSNGEELHVDRPRILKQYFFFPKLNLSWSHVCQMLFWPQNVLFHVPSCGESVVFLAHPTRLHVWSLILALPFVP